MSSFTTVINNIVTTLQNDAALTLFCKTKWSRTLSIKKSYKKREEISIQDLPKILITRPNLEKSFLIGARDGTHTVRLYVGFFQNDKRRALEELIELEEKIDDALTTPEPAALGAISINPKASVNDEGEWHPAYFMVMDIEILHRR